MKGITLFAVASLTLSGFGQTPVSGTAQPVRKSPIDAGFARPLPLGIQGIRRVKLTPGQMAMYAPYIPTNTHFAAVSKPNFLSTTADSGTEPSFQMRGGPPANAVLVLYDGAGDYGFVGNVYARQLANLVRSTGRPVDIKAVESYTTGTLKKYAQTFYLGTEYDNPLPVAFKTDAQATLKPLCWCGYNLWQIAWTADWSADNAKFTKKFGIKFKQMDSRVFASVQYKSKKLDADPYSAGLGAVTVTNAAKANVLAQAVTKSGKAIPYIVQAANLWYVADNPLGNGSVWTTIPRTFVFEDVMHDIVSDGAVEDHPAILRIEDVHAEADPNMLRAIADFLYAENVPYVVCVIPHYRDPLGYWTQGVPKDETINDKPELIAALQYMAAHGGEIIMHGDTHQYDDVPNANSGVSGDDFEFFRIVNDGTGNEVLYGPDYEDSEPWINGRLDEGMSILAKAGFAPTGWNTPHYLASPLDYGIFKQRYSYSFCRGKTFATDAAGYLYMAEQEPGGPIVDDFGMFRFPETLGYVSTPDLGVLRALPQNMINRSKKVNTLRDGWAGCFFHWFLPVTMLQDLVHGLKDQGFHFVAPKSYYQTAPK